MATLKHIASKNSDYTAIEAYLVYQHDAFTGKQLLDEQGKPKLRDSYLLDTLECGDFSFATACLLANRRYGKNTQHGDIKSHQYIISFDPRDAADNGLTMEKAQALGLKFCEENFPGHPAIVCTHPDGHNHSGNIHVHIVIGSIRTREVERKAYMQKPRDWCEGMKHSSTAQTMRHLRVEVMELCEGAGLYQIDLLNGSKERVSEAEYWARRRGQLKLDRENAALTAAGQPPRQKKFETVKDTLRKQISSVLYRAISFEDFSDRLMQQYGITVKESRGCLSYLPAGRTKFIRAKHLGDKFDKAAVLATLQANAERGSDNTETPLAEPPEVDLGSGDVSGTTDVEENELDAENTADAAEIVPVSDEKAEDPEYDSILQELNSSTPAPLDSSGENSLDALLLEGNVENAPPAEDETESADGEAAPQPTAPPAPAGRRDSYILTVDAKDRIETEEERREVIWHEIKTSHIAGRILTGTLDGVEQTPSGRTIVVVDYKGYRIAIPLKEMMLYSGPVPYGAKYKPFMERMNSILATMLTAEIDFIVRGLDNTARSVVASRKAAMLRKRQTFYLDTNEDGVPMIYEGRVVQARVIGVAEKVLRVEVFGVECTIFARDLSAAWFGDAREYYSVGDRVLVRVLTIDRDDINHISITADIRSVSSAANQSNLDKCVLQGKYAGRVTDVRHGVVFIRLNNGVNAVAHTCYDRRMPGKKDDVSFAVTRLDEERGIAVGIITRIIKQNL